MLPARIPRYTTEWSSDDCAFHVKHGADLVSRVPVWRNPAHGNVGLESYWDGAERAAVICDALNTPGVERERMLTELGIR